MRQERVEIASVAETYLAAFNRGDFEACLACYRLPLTFITPRGVSVLQQPEDFLAMWRKTHADMLHDGWSRTVLEEVHVRPLDDGLALCSILVTRLRADDSEIETIGALYTLRQGREGWKIVAVASQRAETLLRFGEAPGEPGVRD